MLACFADRRLTASVAISQDDVFAFILNRASIMPPADRELINQNMRLVTLAAWVEIAFDIFQAEEHTPTLSVSQAVIAEGPISGHGGLTINDCAVAVVRFKGGIEH